MVCRVSQDDYYYPKADQFIDPNGKVNFDLPTAVDLDGLARDLRTLVSGDSIFKKEYTFNNDAKEPKLIELRPAPVILVEGLFVLHHEPIREWTNHVLPAYRNYLMPHRHLCDLHVVNESGFDRGVKVLRDHLMQMAGTVEPIDIDKL